MEVRGFINRHRIFPVLIWALSSTIVEAAPSFQQVGNTLVMSNGDVTLEYNLNAGTTDFYWKNAKKISAFYSGVGLNTGYVKGINYTNWTYSVVSSNQVTVTALGDNLPMMKQYFTLDHRDSFLVRVDMVGTNLSANWMGPVVVDTNGGVAIGAYNDDRALFVPFDNDDFVRYNAMPINSSGTSYEVSAFYDNTTRNGLVVGSVTHDVWKSGVYFSGSNNKLNQMNVFGGATSPWDVMPHGFISGNVISSPTVFVGFGDDWRKTMEDYAAENEEFAPPLVWTNGVPFGWNSWGVTNYQNHITYNAAIAVSDSIHTNLQPYGFTNQGAVYVNLDSYGTYSLNSSQLQNFASHCHANGQKAGIYFTPFTYWGTLVQSSNQIVPGSGYHFGDILLRDSNGNAISYDGALALDPTHPGTKAMILHDINNFISDGFDYLKLDFLSHGALEGIHYDTNVTTGIEAYNQGMQFLLNAVDGKMYISESIAPLFPYQYADSRRIACDAYTSFISNTEYTMNSVTYGWWLDKLYPFNDPDLMVFDNGPDSNEDQSRLISCAITGVFLNGSILTNSASMATAQTYLTNAAIDAVARTGRTFTPVEGNTGAGAANIFVQQDGTTWCIAVFNYTSSATNETVNLSRAGLPPGIFTATNLWDGTITTVSNSFTVSLNAKRAKLFRFALASMPTSPEFGAVTPAGASGFIFSGSNGIPGWPYYVLASAYLTLPMLQWPPIATNTFDADGDFIFTNSVTSNVTQQFYLLETP
jgi:hypothetical protein